MAAVAPQMFGSARVVFHAVEPNAGAHLPSWHSPNYRDTVGPRLLAHRQQHGLPQEEVADELRISQTYLSRLERGQRRPSYEVAKRAAHYLGDLDDDEARTGRSSIQTDGELEQTYDQALISMGAGDDITAETLLVAILQTENSRAMPDDFYAKVRAHLGSIRRDRFDLDGPTGALSLYNDAIGVLFKHSKIASAREITFLQGACLEMKGALTRARLKYEYAQRLGEETSSPQAIVRARNRLGVLATKSGDLDVARALLTDARSGALYLETPGTYGFVTEKLAILETRSGHPDRAVELAASSLHSLLPAEHLRRVQSQTVIADALLAAGDIDHALPFLDSAATLARSHRFDHQFVMLSRLLKQVP